MNFTLSDIQILCEVAKICAEDPKVPAFISVKTLAKRTKKSTVTVYNSVGKLHSKGLLNKVTYKKLNKISVTMPAERAKIISVFGKILEDAK